MNLLVKLSVVPIFFLPLIAGWAGTQEESKVVEQPPVKTTEPWQIAVGGPGWLAGVSGTTGFHGINSSINVSVGQILRHINVIYSFGGEVRRGRFGVLGDLLYLNAQAGADATGLVSKLDLGLQQFLGEFFASYRVIEGPRGWLDLLAGFRYTYLGEQVGLQANNMAWAQSAIAGGPDCRPGTAYNTRSGPAGDREPGTRACSGDPGRSSSQSQ
jgi:hypothetical protein